MKTFFLALISSIFAFTAHAQVKKTTGGCGFNVELTAIPPAGWDYVLYHGQTYTVEGIVHATGCEGATGKVDVKLSGTLMSSQVNPNDWDFVFAVPIELDHIAVGPTALEVIFTAGGAGGCAGSWKTEMNVTIKDSVKTDSVKQGAPPCDSMAVKPPAGGELVIFPVPASASISIKGLRPTETSWAVTVTNVDGRPVPMPAGKLLNGIVTISTLHLPQGRYYLHFQTRERTVGGTIEILR